MACLETLETKDSKTYMSKLIKVSFSHSRDSFQIKRAEKNKRKADKTLGPVAQLVRAHA